jgi:hypothetical protein
VVGGGGRSSMGRVSSGGVGGVLSNSAMGAISGMGDTELLSIGIKTFQNTSQPIRD